MERSRSGESEEAGEKPDFYKDIFGDLEIISADGLRTALVPHDSLDIFIERIKEYDHGAELVGDKFTLMDIEFAYCLDSNNEIFFMKEKHPEED
jgi:hypothetical protein